MGIGRVLGTIAPYAAGYFAPGSQFLTGAFGAAAPIVAGATTGAAISAVEGENPFEGAVMGGLSGYTGGGIRDAFNPAMQANKGLESVTAANKTLAEAPKNVSMMTDPSVLGDYKAISGPGTGFSPSGPDMRYTPYNKGITSLNTTSSPITATTGYDANVGLGEGGYEYTAADRGNIAKPTNDFMRGVQRYGDGSTAMGAAKLGISSIPIVQSTGVFDPDLPTYEDNPMNRYDPKRKLALDNIDTGLNLGMDTGLRLLAKGGQIKKYAEGDKVVRDRSYYGIVPKYEQQQPMYGLGPQPDPVRVPVQGFVDVGGKFKADPKGDITDMEYEKRFKYVTEGVGKPEDQGGDADALNQKGGSGINPAAALTLAQGHANAQESPNESVRLGLQALAGGGYLETGGAIGDGMSDEIKANIDGTQEARLSDGEFVVPADVVSHLGNGSSDAGAKRLYEMMDKVRVARTGNKQQGKEITPERYMPT